MSGYCVRTSTIPTMSDYEEDFGDFPSEYKEEPKRIIGWSISRRVDITIYSRKWNHNKNSSFFSSSTFSFEFEELIEDFLDLAVLEETERGPALKNRLVGAATTYIGRFNRESLRATDRSKVFQEYVETPLHLGSSECTFLEILSFQSSKKRKFRISQVDRQVFTVFAALKRRLDGQLADVFHERRTKMRSVSCQRGSGEC